MLYRKFSLSEFSHGKLKSGCEVSLTAFILENYKEINPQKKRPLVIICPGGGFHFVSDREGEPIAIKLMSNDISALVLNYSLSPYSAQAPLELSAAISFAKENAKEWNIDEKKITVMGFSAGGYIAGAVSVMSNTKEYAECLGLSEQDITPRNAVLCYPLISTNSDVCNDGELEYLFGKDANRKALSLETQVNRNTLPAFIWTTKTDEILPFKHSILFEKALSDNNIKHFFKLFNSGIHGLALADEITKIEEKPETVNPEVSEWFDLSVKFITDKL